MDNEWTIKKWMVDCIEEDERFDYPRALKFDGYTNAEIENISGERLPDWYVDEKADESLTQGVGDYVEYLRIQRRE